MRTRIWLPIAALTAASLALGAFALAQDDTEGADRAGLPMLAPVQYSVKYVCGDAPFSAEDEWPVKPGNYATAINIHNYTDLFDSGSYRVAIHYRIGQPAPPVIPPKVFPIRARRVAEIDCTTIWAVVGVPPGTFLKGMVHIGTGIEYPVVAVYTSQTDLTPGVPPTADAGISIDVEYVDPFIVGVPLAP